VAISSWCIHRTSGACGAEDLGMHGTAAQLQLLLEADPTWMLGTRDLVEKSAQAYLGAQRDAGVSPKCPADSDKLSSFK
jgi:hypothetical protein